MRLSVSKKVFGGSITSSGRSWYGSLMLDMRFWSSPIPRRSVVIRIWSLNSDMRRRGFYTFAAGLRMSEGQYTGVARGNNSRHRRPGAQASLRLSLRARRLPLLDQFLGNLWRGAIAVEGSDLAAGDQSAALAVRD